jgi:hypothetical protein
VHVRARELSGEEFRRASAALARRYPLLHGVVIPATHRMARTRTINLELTAAE